MLLYYLATLGFLTMQCANNVDVTKSTSMDDANTGARLLSVIQPKPHPKSISEGDEIPNSKEPLSQSTKRRRISATSSCHASTPKKKVRIGSKDQTVPQTTSTRGLLSGPRSRRRRPMRIGDRNGGLHSDFEVARRMILAKDRDALAIMLKLAERCFLAANAACH